MYWVQMHEVFVKGSRDLGADQGKRYDHERQKHMTSFIGWAQQN